MTLPILLAHGACRFDRLWSDPSPVITPDDPGDDRHCYFKGIRPLLVKNGFPAYLSNVSWGAGVDIRAADLLANVKTVLDHSGADRVNIIAHSMGGLDARRMLFNDRLQGGIHHRIASLTTLSTPHHGTPFADWGIHRLPAVIPTLQAMGLDLAALEDLRTPVCARFNNDPEVQAFEAALESTIRFRTFAGRQSFAGIFAPLKPSYLIIHRSAGANDGLVPIYSARWKSRYVGGTMENTDHLNALGWWEPDQLITGEGPARLLRRIHRYYLQITASLP